MKTTIYAAALVVIGAIFGFGFSTCGTVNSENSQAKNNNTSVTAIAQAMSPSSAFAKIPGNEASIADIAEKTVASVVNISSEKVIRNNQGQQFSPFFSDPFFRHFFGQPFNGPQIPQEQRQKSLGSGVIATTDGIVLTNNHVVEQADKIQIGLADGRNFDAEIVGTDPKSDVAVLRLKGELNDLKPAKIGDSAKLRLGDIVLAIGNPFGVGQTVTMGIISAKGRADVGIIDYEDFIQTDAAINPGNSGGALINMQGELIGINTAILSRSGGYQGIGFAIPSNMVKVIMESLIKHGKVVRGWLGVAIQDIDENLAEAMKLKVHSGVLISDVTEKSPARAAGVKRGDVVLKVDGETVDSTGKLRNLISIRGPDKNVKLEILRDSKKIELMVKLAQMPADLGGIAEIDQNEGVLGGLKLGAINDHNKDKYKLPEKLDHGVVVIDVDPNSSAASAGFRPGDVILEINRKEIKSVKEFSNMYKKAKNRILLLVHRRGSTMYLVLSKNG
ncbi:MAG: DegQ family serine endoprotease [Deltaproteobacteria bacterium]|nr:DegQ family serine endoprotease [Deltaproteobacteria bacterium]